MRVRNILLAVALCRHGCSRRFLPSVRQPTRPSPSPVRVGGTWWGCPNTEPGPWPRPATPRVRSPGSTTPTPRSKPCSRWCRRTTSSSATPIPCGSDSSRTAPASTSGSMEQAAPVCARPTTARAPAQPSSPSRGRHGSSAPWEAGNCQFFRAGVAVGNPGTCQAAITWDFAAGTKIFAVDNGRTYARGAIRIRPVGEGFHVVLEIGIDDYLYGLGEMPSHWPNEALHAQAIAARTYGVRQAIRYGPADALDAARRVSLLVPPVQHGRRPGVRRLVERSRPVRCQLGSGGPVDRRTGRDPSAGTRPLHHRRLLRQLDRGAHRQQRRRPRAHDPACPIWFPLPIPGRSPPAAQNPVRHLDRRPSPAPR